MCVHVYAYVCVYVCVCMHVRACVRRMLLKDLQPVLGLPHGNDRQLMKPLQYKVFPRIKRISRIHLLHFYVYIAYIF